jgi:hypothetical protein
MDSDCPLHSIQEALIYSQYLGIKTHRFMHDIYNSYSKDVRKLILCKECQLNRDRTAAMRMARMRQREQMLGKPKTPFWATPTESVDAPIDLSLVNMLIGSPEAMQIELNEDTLTKYKASLLSLIAKRKNVCLEDISSSRDELILNLIAMLFLAQEDKIGGFEQRENRIWVF